MVGFVAVPINKLGSFLFCVCGVCSSVFAHDHTQTKKRYDGCRSTFFFFFCLFFFPFMFTYAFFGWFSSATAAAADDDDGGGTNTNDSGASSSSAISSMYAIQIRQRKVR